MSSHHRQSRRCICSSSIGRRNANLLTTNAHLIVQFVFDISLGQSFSSDRIPVLQLELAVHLDLMHCLLIRIKFCKLDTLRLIVLSKVRSHFQGACNRSLNGLRRRIVLRIVILDDCLAIRRQPRIDQLIVARVNA